MKRKKLNFPVCLVLFSLSVLWLLPISAMAEGDGGWTSTDAPGYIFQIEEDLFNNQKHLVMTVINPDREGVEFYWGLASVSVGSTYLLEPLDADSDMKATWQFNSNTQATVTVDSCTTNCLWQPGQVVTLNKFFGDMKADAKFATRVPKTGQTGCWDDEARSIDCRNTGQDGEYQFGVLPAVLPSSDNPYTVHGWKGVRFTDNKDGTVTDNLTGLIWLKNANCFGWRTWSQALSDCNNLASGSCGLTDGSSVGEWRLPNINELHSLVDPTQMIPALPQGYPFTSVQIFYYWTSTTNITKNWEAWIMTFIGDDVGPSSKTYNNISVWPVRSGN